MEIKVIGSLESKFESTNRIYDVGGCSPTLSTMQGGDQEPKILESQIVAMRGRNPDNPSDRTSGSPTEQRLEPNMSGTSNCLTSVQKDNLVMESVKIKQATKGGYIECDIGGCFDASYPESETRRGRVQDNGNTCPTLTAQNQDICRIEKAGQILNDGSQCGTFVQYSIRKLTPRECGRLMGVSDEDISKMAEVNSNTQLYKQFGNSIVVDVMCAMFKNLNINQKIKCEVVNMGNQPLEVKSDRNYNRAHEMTRNGKFTVEWCLEFINNWERATRKLRGGDNGKRN